MNTAMLRNMSNEELDRMIPFIITSHSLTEQDILNEIQRRVGELDEEIEEETTSRIADITGELTEEHDREIDDLKEERKNKIDELNKQLEDYSYASKDQKVQIMSLTRKLESITEEQDYVPNEILKLKDDISRLQRKYQKAEELRIKSAKENIRLTASLDGQINEQNDELSKHKEQTDKFHQLTMTIEGSRDEARREVQRLNTKLDANNSKLEYAVDKLAAREKQVTVLIKQNAVLASEGKHDTEIDDLKEEYGDKIVVLNEKLEGYIHTSKNQTAHILALTEQVHIQGEELDQTEDANSRLRSDRQVLGEQLAAREKQVEALIKQNDELTSASPIYPSSSFSSSERLVQPPDITRENLDRFIHSMRTAISVLEKDVYPDEPARI